MSLLAILKLKTLRFDMTRFSAVVTNDISILSLILPIILPLILYITKLRRCVPIGLLWLPVVTTVGVWLVLQPSSIEV